MDNVSLSSHFNSQPHEEADPRTGHAVCRLLVISTHSLTRRLTPHTFRENVIKNNFNSQPHEEADKSSYISGRGQWYFNSQPHEEADGNTLMVETVQQPYFNSQPHEEADNLLVLPTADPGHFNSQPHEEADYNTYYIGTCNIISTHSLTRRLTSATS